MGIRFPCPTCEELLNIKKVHRGKSGRCPHCNGKIRVPSKSHSSRTKTESTAKKPSKASPPAEPEKRKPKPQKTTPSQPQASAPAKDDFLCGQPGTQAHANYVDPIQEAPHRVWHIRDSKLNESGPFTGKKLRRKIDSGQVKPNDSVCREDWQDWISAAQAFPELGAGHSQIPLASDSVFTDSNYEISGAMTPKARKAKKKQRNQMIGITLCVVGLLITVALCYLLIQLI